MSAITHEPVPPFSVRQACLGHAFGYATMWEIVDAEGKLPWDAIKDNTSDTLMDEAWCRATADRLNAASVDTHAKHRDVKQARPARVGSAVLRQQQTPEHSHHPRDPDNG